MRASLLFALACSLLPLVVPGTAAANSGAVLSMQAGEYEIPYCVAAEPDSGALILMAASQDGLASLWIQRVDRHGRRLLGDRGQFLMSIDGNHYPSWVADGAGGIVVAVPTPRGATGLDIVVHRIAPDGSLPYGPDGLVVCDAARDQDQIFVQPGPAGYFFVAWRDDRANLGGRYDLYAQKVSVAGAPQWTANGVLVNSASYRPWSYGIDGVVPDLQGGLVMTYTYNSYGGVTRAQRLNGAGALQWTANGVDFGNSTYGARSITPDGLGGVWGVAGLWDGTNTRSYAYHLGANGTPVFAGGVEYANAAPQQDSRLIRNASGGCFIYTAIGYSGSSYVNVVLQEISSGGVLLRGAGGESTSLGAAPQLFDFGTSYGSSVVENTLVPPRRRYRVQQYGFDGSARLPGAGVAIGRPEGFLLDLGVPPALASSPTGVLVSTWADSRYFSSLNPAGISVFGQALDAAGAPLWDDSEEPVCLGVQDAPADQGGRVRVTWSPSAADAAASGTARGYRVWRALPATLAAALEASRPAGDEAMFQAEGRTLLATASGYWEMAGEQAAAQLAGYALTVTTGLDSTAAGPADQSFMVEAYDDSSHHWYSGALTGHSVDNLAPGLVPSAAGFYAGGTSLLYWGGVSDADLLGYEVFRGSSPAFAPTDANRIASTSQVTWTDAHGAPAFYRIAARDIHGNLGPSALIVPAGTLAADDAGPTTWRLFGDWRSGRLRLALDVPAADEGRLDLYDVSGRRLWSSEFHTGRAQALEFTPPASGLRPGVCYAHARSASGRTLTAKVIVLR